MAGRTMSDLVSTYEPIRRKKISSRSWDCERGALQKLCRWYGTRRAGTSITDADMEDFLYGPKGLLEGGVSQKGVRGGRLQPVSFNKQLQYLRQFIEWGIRRELFRGELLEVMVDLPEPGRKFERLSLAQMWDMIQQAEDPWERWLLALTVQTLARASEVRMLKVSDFHLDEGFVSWFREKTDEWDELPITEDLADEYRLWLTHYSTFMHQEPQPDWFVVPMRRGRPGAWAYNTYQSQRDLGPVVKRHAANYLSTEALKGQAMHLLRRSAARELYEQLRSNGVEDPLRVVMAMCGHRNAQTTEIYIGLERDRQRRNDLLRGARVLSVDTSNVVSLQQVRDASG